MIAILTYYAAALCTEIFKSGHLAADGERPHWQLNLKVKAHAVSNIKGCFGRTPRMETKMIESVASCRIEHFMP